MLSAPCRRAAANEVRLPLGAWRRVKKAEDRFVVSDLVGPNLIDSRDTMRLSSGEATVTVRDGQFSEMTRPGPLPYCDPPRRGCRRGRPSLDLDLDLDRCVAACVSRGSGQPCVPTPHAEFSPPDSSTRDFNHPTLPMGP